MQYPIENIRTGREIQEVVTVRFVPNKSVHGSLHRHWGLILMILFTQLQYGACTFICNDCLYNVLQALYFCCLRMYKFDCYCYHF